MYRASMAAVVGLLLFVGPAWTQQNAQQKKQSEDQPKNQQIQPGQANQQFPGNAEKFIRENDRNKDGFLGRDELPANLREGFERIDTNRDGRLSREELQQHSARARRRMMPGEAVTIWVFSVQPGNVSVEDLQEAYDLLRKVDHNKDGKLTREEVKASLKEMCQHRLTALIRRCDENQDQRISRDEACGALRNHFDRYDTNHDGFVDRNELEQAIQQPRSEVTSTEEPTGTRATPNAPNRK